ncbi:MAG: DUF6265 family protein [Sphingomonadaceae bacterium]|nr:DUF6265 family protein [Sphingomonadaceae bacterium]
MIAALALLLGAAAPEPPAGSTPASPSVDRLTWLAGEWVSESADRWTEEQWSAPRGGLMLGLGRSGKYDRAMGFEFMRIAAEADGRILFWGAPGGQAPVAFRLVEQDATSAVFENPRHDFPKRVAYRRDGNRLIATISGDGGEAQSWTYQRREPPTRAAGRARD